MKEAQLYFLSDQYYRDFPDDKLMRNKEMIAGRSSDRPCFFAFSDKKIPEISWLVPISSKTEKYRYEEQKKINKHGRCNTIRFGSVLGREAAFLIQNMCPVTDKYISPYIDKNKQPIKIDNRVIADVIKNAHEVLGIANRGAKIIFPDIKTIYATLVHQLEQEKKTELTAKPPAPEQPAKLSMKDRFAAAQAEADRRSQQTTDQQHTPQHRLDKSTPER